ncbi:MAG: hypothetical protein LUF01_06370 [Bacteroides sp.]|nr:hypothetical protein [Bacteroides sp.]
MNQITNNSYESPEVTIIEVAIECGFVSTIEDDPFEDGDGDVVFPR